jgi:flavin-dependent dehydrogenase
MKTDVAIVGGGPAGSAAAMYLARHGIEVVMVEKVPFPRYHIGESLTAEAGGLLRGLGFEERMLGDGHPIKHGVKVYGGNSWWVPAMQRLPDGSLMDQITWQVRRSDFDAMLLEAAASRGAALIPGKVVKPLVDEGGAVRGLMVRPADGGNLTIEAEVVLDCSGQATFLATHGVAGPKYLGAYDKQIAIFSQVVGYERDDGSDRDQMPGNTLIHYKDKFVWAWSIPLDDEVVSVGVVSPAQYFLDSKETTEEFIRRELRERHPDLARRTENVEFVEPAHVIPNYSFQVANFAGKGFICVGDSHRFIDPIFSFGVYVTLKEAGLAADTVKEYLEGNGHRRESDTPFHDHVLHCERAIDVLEDLIDAFWENPLAFAYFVHSRYREALIDTFSGRIYIEDGLPTDFPSAMRAFRKLLKRERMYDNADFSVPIGSRFDPSRAPLWNSTLDSLETTERWMRDQVDA